MAKSPTLNRFPLFGLFANRAARTMGYTDDEALRGRIVSIGVRVGEPDHFPLTTIPRISAGVIC